MIIFLELNRSLEGKGGHISPPCTRLTSYAHDSLLLLVPFNRLEAVIAVRRDARDRSAKYLRVRPIAKG